MVISAISNRISSCWLHISVFLCMVAMLPSEIALAQDYQAVEKRLKKSVKKGEITEAQAYAMMAALKKTVVSKDKKELDHKSIAAQLKAAVKAGKLTEEQAKAKWTAITQGTAVKAAQVEFNQAWAKVQLAVAEGKLSAEDAKAKLLALKKEISAKTQGGKQDVKAKTDVFLKQVWAKLQAAVAEGKLTAEDAEAKMIALKKEISSKAKGGK